MITSYFLLLAGSNNGKALMCYFGSWSTYRWSFGHFDVEDIDPFLCTHLVFGFAGLDQNNFTLISLDPYNDLYDNWGKGAYQRFTDLKTINPQLKVPFTSQNPSGSQLFLTQKKSFFWADRGLVNQGLSTHLLYLTRLLIIISFLQTLLAIGGWNEGATKYSQMASDPAKRSRFIQSALDMVLEHNFDGLDLDWEYPGTAV